MSQKSVSRRQFFSAALVALGVPVAVHANTCYTCQGSGTGTFVCSFCKGSGQNNGFKCSLCHGRGFPPCPSCRGTGRR